MQDQLTFLNNGYLLVEVVTGAQRSTFLAFAPSGEALGRFPTRESAEEAADETWLASAARHKPPAMPLFDAERFCDQ